MLIGVPPVATHFRGIDQLRGFAALAVVCCHFATSSEAVVTHAKDQPLFWLVQLLSWGYLGVPLFFVISGLCIHLPAANAIASTGTFRRDWRRFFLRRFWRLYPPYIAVLAASALLLFVVRGSLPVGWRGALAQALLVHVFHPATFDGLNPPAWTLAVEAQLYLVYPIALALFMRFGAWRGLGLILGVTMLYRTILNFGVVPDAFGGLAWEFFPARWWEWCLGALIAAWVAGSVSIPRWTRTGWLGCIVFAGAIRLEWETWRVGVYTFKEPLYGLAFALLVLSVLDRERRRGFVAARGAGRYLGEIGVFSYSLYLVHRPIQLAFEPLVRWIVAAPVFDGFALPVSLALMAATTPVVMVCARALHHFVEAPSVRIAQRVGKSPEVAPGADGPSARPPSGDRTQAAPATPTVARS